MRNPSNNIVPPDLLSNADYYILFSTAFCYIYLYAWDPRGDLEVSIILV